MKGFIHVTVDKTTGKKGLINIANIVFAEPFPTDVAATVLYLSTANKDGSSFQVVVDETLENITQLIRQAQ